MFAVCSGDMKCTMLLLQKGAELDVADKVSYQQADVASQ